MTFRLPDKQKYPSINLGYAAGRADGTMTGVISAANEKAVEMFIEEKYVFFIFIFCFLFSFMIFLNYFRESFSDCLNCTTFDTLTSLNTKRNLSLSNTALHSTLWHLSTPKKSFLA